MTDKWTDGRTNGWTDGQTDGGTDRRTVGRTDKAAAICSPIEEHKNKYNKVLQTLHDAPPQRLHQAK